MLTHTEKENVIREYRKKFRYDILIETGTHFGCMVDAMESVFKQIISIELGTLLAYEMKLKFAQFEHITIIQGDSGVVLKDVLMDITFPCIFWLDAHYSNGSTVRGEKDTPIMEELNCIFDSDYNHVILIDDARCFDGKNSYPTLDYLKDYFLRHRPNWTFEVKQDIIRVYENGCN